MTTLRFLLVALLSTGILIGCKNEGGTTPAPTTASQTELLTANNWRINRVSTPEGQSINKERLNLVTQFVFALDMQFRANGTVRAIDQRNQQIVNGGTWKLSTDNKSMDVDVTGFKGNFPIVELSRIKLILRQRAPVDGKDADINLEFDPSL
ncbi:hypothetical protein [Spirosoma arcticum]